MTGPDLTSTFHQRPSPPRLSTPTNNSVWGRGTVSMTVTAATATGGRGTSPNPRAKKRKPWRKLLWVKQDCKSTPSSATMTLADFQTADPDNWVDPTFLSQLQRNINVHPYDFYSLVADSTVIVQHLSSVVIFVTSFIAISAKRVSPVAVAVASSALTVAGWAIWDMGYEKREAATDMRNMRMRLGLDIPGGPHSRTPSGNGSHLRTPSGNGNGGGGLHSRTPSGSGNVNAAGSYFPPYHAGMESSGGSPTKRSVGEDRVVSTEADREYVKKAQRARRLTTAKSAALIYCIVCFFSFPHTFMAAGHNTETLGSYAARTIAYT